MLAGGRQPGSGAPAVLSRACITARSLNHSHLPVTPQILPEGLPEDWRQQQLQQTASGGGGGGGSSRAAAAGQVAAGSGAAEA